MDIPIEAIGVVLTLAAAGVGLVTGRVTKKVDRSPHLADRTVLNRRYKFVTRDMVGDKRRAIYVNRDDPSDRVTLED